MVFFMSRGIHVRRPINVSLCPSPNKFKSFAVKALLKLFDFVSGLDKMVMQPISYNW